MTVNYQQANKAQSLYDEEIENYKTLVRNLKRLMSDHHSQKNLLLRYFHSGG